MNYLKWVVKLLFVSILITACTTNRQLVRQIYPDTDEVLSQAFVGICIYDDKAQQYVYEYQSEKQFIPASNIKLLTAYAAMRHLPDSLPGWLYRETGDTIFLRPAGDPTFLHPAFPEQKLFNTLNTTRKVIVLKWPATTDFRRLGYGWAWNNYQESYMPERSVMPIYGNVVRFTRSADSILVHPPYFRAGLVSDGDIADQPVTISRNENDNGFIALPSSRNRLVRPFTQKENPAISYSLLKDTLVNGDGMDIHLAPYSDTVDTLPYQPFYTQATDTVLQYMMHRSDNFLAEQLLLMVGNRLSGTLNGSKTRRFLFRNDFDFMANRPRWVDGSGLSRYNALSPRDIVALLTDMKQSIPRLRITSVLPHGNQGTLKGYYTGHEQYIHAKTGTLGNNIALSGYLTTKRGKELTFSFLVNNHQSTATAVRHSIERILTQLIEKY